MIAVHLITPQNILEYVHVAMAATGAANFVKTNDCVSKRLAAAASVLLLDQ